MYLSAITHSLRARSAATVTTAPRFWTSYIDIGTDDFQPQASADSLNGVTNVTLVPAPVSGLTRQIKLIAIYNADSVSQAITVEFLDDITARLIKTFTLAAGETLEYSQEHGWRIFPSPLPTDFLALTDTPNSYSGQAGQVVAVNAGETALEFIAPSGGGSNTFYGALAYLSASLTGLTTEGPTLFTDGAYNVAYDPNDGGAAQRMWLGANFTFATTDVDTGTDTITETGHGFATGEGPVQFTSSTTLPAGISAATNYWIISTGANTFQVAVSRAAALAAAPVDITSQGTGTHTCQRGGRLVVPANVNYVRLTGGLLADTDLAGQLVGRVYKNASIAYPGRANQEDDSTGTKSVSISTPVLAVSEGDYFELSNFGADAYTLLANATYFSIEIVE